MVDNVLSYPKENITSPTLDAFLNVNKTPIKKDTRNLKGYKWEMVVGFALKQIPLIEYEGNPTNYHDWLQDHNKSRYDGAVTLPNGEQIIIEMKFRDCKKVYHSWFMDCWLPREADVFVTNNTNVISYRDKRMLDYQHIKLMSLSEFAVYLGKILRNILHPRKYLYFNCIFNDIIRVIVRLFINSLDFSKHFFDRFHWFKLKFLHKSNKTMFLKAKFLDWVIKLVLDVKLLKAGWIKLFSKL